MSSNASSSPQPSLVANVYCILSALFFATCAYAQLNDPAPLLWVTAYLGLGTVPNLLLTSFPISTIPLTTMRLTLLGGATLLALVVLYKVITVMPKLELEASQGLGWHFLEHEEGRDSCGLLLLVLHSLYLTASYLQHPQSLQRRRSSNKLKQSSLLGGDVFASLSAVASSSLVQSVFLLSILVGAVYLWVVHHPDMVAKYQVPHCQGGMFGSDGIAGDL